MVRYLLSYHVIARRSFVQGRGKRGCHQPLTLQETPLTPFTNELVLIILVVIGMGHKRAFPNRPPKDTHLPITHLVVKKEKKFIRLE